MRESVYYACLPQLKHAPFVSCEYTESESRGRSGQRQNVLFVHWL